MIWAVMNRSVTNVVCFEWSVMSRSVVNGHRNVQYFFFKVISLVVYHKQCCQSVVTEMY